MYLSFDGSYTVYTLHVQILVDLFHENKSFYQLLILHFRLHTQGYE